MKTYRELIAEMARSTPTKKKEKPGSLGDSRGKVVEIGTANHLLNQPDPDEHSPYNNRGTPFHISPEISGKDEEGRSPRDSHEHHLSVVRKKGGEEEVKKAKEQAKATADAIRSHVAETHPDHRISAVRWTGTTTQAEKNDPADIKLELTHKSTGEKKTVGYSLKANKKSTNRVVGANIGAEAMGPSVQAMHTAHQKRQAELIRQHYGKSEDDKVFNKWMKNPSNRKNKLPAALKAKLNANTQEHLTAVARHIHDSFKTNNDQIGHIRTHVFGPSETEGDTHTVATDWNKGKARAIVSSGKSKAEETMARAHHFSSEHNGHSVSYYAHNRDGTKTKIGTSRVKLKSTRDPLSALTNAGLSSK